VPENAFSSMQSQNHDQISPKMEIETKTQTRIDVKTETDSQTQPRFDHFRFRVPLSGNDAPVWATHLGVAYAASSSNSLQVFRVQDIDKAMGFWGPVQDGETFEMQGLWIECEVERDLTLAVLRKSQELGWKYIVCSCLDLNKFETSRALGLLSTVTVVASVEII
jgi:hypothetical protein